MANHMKRYFPGIDTGPLFYISTHGFYDLEKYTKGSDPIETKVPENTLVIETSAVENYCFFTNVLQIMGPLFENRQRLLSYIGGLIPEGDSEGVSSPILACLKTCYFYKPGAIIPNRILEFTGGLDRSDKSFESERIGHYSKMGFFKYGPEGNRSEIFPELRTQLVTGAYGILANRGSKVLDGPYESYAKMFPRIEPLSDSPFKIIFFSSCGELRQTVPANFIMLQRIQELQRLAAKTWATALRVNIPQLYSSVRLAPITANNVVALGLRPGNAIPKKISNFQGAQDPEVTRVLRKRTSKKASKNLMENENNNHQPRTWCNALGQCFRSFRPWGGKRTRRVKRKINRNSKKTRRTL